MKPLEASPKAVQSFIEFGNLPCLSLKHREPFLYVGRGSVSVDDGGWVVHTAHGATQVPVASIACILLEPGVTVTHDAVKLCAKVQTTLLWVSEAATRLYAAGAGGLGPAKAKEAQIRAWADEALRLEVARRMFVVRFQEDPGYKEVEQLRGLEGIRVRALYQILARQAGIQWIGRRYDRTRFDAGDAANRALTAANQCLYAVTEAAVRASGYDPTLGFLHAGSSTAFVQDIADLFKFQHSVPVAFQVAAQGDHDLTNRTRIAMRDRFRRTQLLDRIIKAIPPLFEGL